MNQSNSTSTTAARPDFLGFGSGESLDGRKVSEFLGLTKPDIARIAHVRTAAVRFDTKMPTELRERVGEIADTLQRVAQFFDASIGKTALWLRTPNPMLGNISPREMIRNGRHDRLRRFVVDALDESARETRAANIPMA